MNRLSPSGLRVWQPYDVETLTELDALDILLRSAALFQVVAAES